MSKKTLVYLACFFLILVVSARFIMFSILNWPQNVSSEPKYAEIYNQTFKVQNELFICQWPDTKELYLQEYISSHENTIGKIEKGALIRVKAIVKQSRMFVGTNVKVLVARDDAFFHSHEPIDASHLIINYLRLGYSDDLALFDSQYLKNTKTRTLQTAVRYQNFKLIKQLIEKGADINQPDLDGKTPLHYAQQTHIVKYLLENAANAQLTDKLGKTPLHYAAKNNNIGIMKLLIENGVSIDPKDKEENTPLLIAADAENFDSVALLLKSGADILIKGKYQNTILLYAAQSDRLDIIEWSLKLGADPLAVCGLSQMTGILFAARNDNIDMAKLLIGAGASVNNANNDGDTPLHYACENLQMLNLLIESGANIHQVNNRGQTVLHRACYANDLNIIQFLCENGARINQSDNYGVTPFLEAISAPDRGSKLKIIEWLIGQGANVCQFDNEGRTALDYARTYTTNPAIVKYLLKHGACANSPPTPPQN